VLRFGVKALVLGMIVVGCFCTFALYRNQTAYFLISTLLPCVIGLFVRYSLKKSNALSMTSTFVSAIVTGGMLMAYGSYFLTFVEPSQGILIGGGWSSVMAAAMFGAGVGFVCSLLAILFYSISTSVIDLIRKTPT